LRYMKNPADAFDHFSRIPTRVITPYAKARAGYWAGRAAAAQVEPELAATLYAAAADHRITFYGQLAAHQLGDDAPPRPAPEPVPDAAELAGFNQSELVRATRIFLDLGYRDQGKIFLLNMADGAARPTQFAMLATLAESGGRVDLAVAVARRAIDVGTPLMIHGYPVTPLPSGGTAEHSLLFAITRQESAFEREAVSRAGARGLMQLMPATARHIADKMQLPFSAERLTADGTYNVLLGRAYLESLIDDFGGSYPLAIAAYNAGPGRVRQWLRDYGDPRAGKIEMVDWIENIPISETRNYVQRVLENLQVYRGQGGRNSALSLASDLAR
jgi:soluble lytic murein transglycosylase